MAANAGREGRRDLGIQGVREGEEESERTMGDAGRTEARTAFVVELLRQAEIGEFDVAILQAKRVRERQGEVRSRAGYKCRVVGGRESSGGNT